MSPAIADAALWAVLITGSVFAFGVFVGAATSAGAFAYRTKRRELEHAERMAVLAQRAERERALLVVDASEVKP